MKKMILSLAIFPLLVFAACQPPVVSVPEPTPIPTGEYSMLYHDDGCTGGTVPVDLGGYDTGVTVMVSGNTGDLFRTGFAFAGWNTVSDRLGTSYAAGASFAMGAGDVDLYPVWLPDTLTFTSSDTTIALTGSTTKPTGDFIVPAGVTIVEDYAYSNCFDMTSVVFPSTCRVISYLSFNNNYAMTSVFIPEGVREIEHLAFQSCRGLTEISIPASISNMESLSFYDCTSLTDINVDAANSHFSSTNGVVYDKPATVLKILPCGYSGACVIPDGVLGVDREALYACKSLTALVLPASLTDFQCINGMGTCVGLTSITVDSANTSFSAADGALFDKAGTALLYAAGGISGDYAVPSNVTTLGAFAFCDCAKITSVTIPSGVTSVGDYAFNNCKTLYAVTVLNGVPCALGTWAFASCASSLQIHVPAGTLNVYKTASGWSSYASIIVSP